MSSRRATPVDQHNCKCKHEPDHASAASLGTWKEVAATYPSTSYLHELCGAVDRAVNPRRGDGLLNASHRWPDDLTRRIAYLSPVLDDWFGKRTYWYADDIMEGVNEVTAAKAEAVEALKSSNDGSRALRSGELIAIENDHEARIDALLNVDEDNEYYE